MFENSDRFTESAQAIVAMAQHFAENIDSDFIATDHLLLALIFTDESLPQQVLISEGYDDVKIYRRIDCGMEETPAEVPFTTSTKEALDHALLEALAHGSTEVDDIDILLGILRPQDGNKAVAILKHYGGDDAVNSLRRAITRQLAPVSTASVETLPKDEDYTVIKLPIPKAIAAISDNRVSLLKQIVRNLTDMTFEEMQKILQLVKLPADKRRQLLKSIP